LTIHVRRGIHWTDAPADLSMFNTALPPNAPACAESGEWGDHDNVVLPPNSAHPGGVNGVMCDDACGFSPTTSTRATWESRKLATRRALTEFGAQLARSRAETPRHWIKHLSAVESR